VTDGTTQTFQNVASTYEVDNLLPDTSYEIQTKYVVRGASGPYSSVVTFRTARSEAILSRKKLLTYGTAFRTCIYLDCAKRIVR